MVGYYKLTKLRRSQMAAFLRLELLENTAHLSIKNELFRDLIDTFFVRDRYAKDNALRKRVRL